MTDLILAKTTAQQHQAEAALVVEVVRDFKITDDVSYKAAGELLIEVKGAAKELDEVRTSFVKPLNDIVREVNAFFKPAQDFFKQAEAVAKAAIGAYVLAQRAEQQRLLLAASTAAAQVTVAQVVAGRPDPAVTLMQAAQDAAAPQMDGVSIREVFEWDLMDASQVPREYLSPDTAKINAAVKAGVHDIPGIRVRIAARVVARVGG